MATVTAVVQNVQIERGDDDARAAAIGNLKRATVYFDNGGVAVTSAGSDVLSINLATAIQNKVRNGKTVTVRTASISQALTTQLLAAPFTEVTHAGFINAAISSSTIAIVALRVKENTSRSLVETILSCKDGGPRGPR